MTLVSENWFLAGSIVPIQGKMSKAAGQSGQSFNKVRSRCKEAAFARRSSLRASQGLLDPAKNAGFAMTCGSDK
jgi:hypothetical protein